MLLSTSPTQCFKEVRVTTKTRVLPSGTVANSAFRKYRRGILVVETCYRLGSTIVDVQSVINWTVCRPSTKLTTSELGRSTAAVYHNDLQALSTARHAGLLAMRMPFYFSPLSYEYSVEHDHSFTVGVCRIALKCSCCSPYLPLYVRPAIQVYNISN